jgi:nucleoside triphosphatase
MNQKKFPEPVVGAFIFNNEGQILLLQEAKFDDQFVPPGGHIEIGETFEEALPAILFISALAVQHIPPRLFSTKRVRITSGFCPKILFNSPCIHTPAPL